ncbi:acetate/propionate family kinase [Ligilactobacillus sp. LYQ139]|uniref:acetate/propionate family kinase n=1 Tax=Ligilactobacillus sp. LYQ139 TaxID=3378800 RepID=UPI0038543074
MEKIMAINSGSSSLKFKLFAMPAEKELAAGQIERIGIDGSRVTIKNQAGEKYTEETPVPDHKAAVGLLMKLLRQLSIVTNPEEITGVGHRVVAGGEVYKQSVIVSDDDVAQIKALAEYAPLHNPANGAGIQAFRELLPQAVSVAVFDTSFHQTLPPENYIYSVPYEWYEKWGVRRYGAHGTSHRYVTQRAADLLGKPYEQLKLISCHLGNGSSICAVQNGQSFDTSMGFTPLAGLTMGTRSGDVDPSLVGFVMDKLGITNGNEMVTLLNHEAGLKGISGISSDMRDILAQAADGNDRAQLALDIFVRNIVRYVGQYVAEMGGADAIIFTAGIGENSAPIRRLVLERLAYLGIKIDSAANEHPDGDCAISTADSAVAVLRVKTNEELMIARDVQRLAHEAH